MSAIVFNNSRLKKIVNVYQSKYTNFTAQGFGDYLRGCYCFFQICINLGLEFDMNIKNHPMSKYMKCEDHTDSNINYNQIEWYLALNYVAISDVEFTKEPHFLSHVKSYLNNIKTDILYFGSNSFPIWEPIGRHARDFIRKKIQPSNEMQKYVNQTLMKLRLVPKRFSVIHIRTGDNYLLNNNTIDKESLMNIENLLLNYTNTDQKYLILSDNNSLKTYLTKWSNFYIYTKEITHLGENAVLTDEGIKNTMLDFYIMAYSSKILSVSPHTWGSGFSEWCAVTYEIPFKKIILQFNKKYNRDTINENIKGIMNTH